MASPSHGVSHQPSEKRSNSFDTVINVVTVSRHSRYLCVIQVYLRSRLNYTGTYMELHPREKRAIMLERQRPAYARSAQQVTAIDDLYRRARTLERVTGVRHSVRAIIPHEHTYVSGLNVLNNFAIVVDGKQGGLHETRVRFERRQKVALKRLESRFENNS